MPRRTHALAPKLVIRNLSVFVFSPANRADLSDVHVDAVQAGGIQRNRRQHQKQTQSARRRN